MYKKRQKPKTQNFSALFVRKGCLTEPHVCLFGVRAVLRRPYDLGSPRLFPISSRPGPRPRNKTTDADEKNSTKELGASAARKAEGVSEWREIINAPGCAHQHFRIPFYLNTDRGPGGPQHTSFLKIRGLSSWSISRLFSLFLENANR